MWGALDLISLISTQQCRPPGLASRILGKMERYNFIESYVLGVPILRADMNIYGDIGEKKLMRQAVNFAGELSHMNVGGILIDSRFPCKEAFDRFARLDSRYLYENMAGKIGMRAAGNDRGTAAFFAGTIGRNEERALLELARAYRYLIIVTDRDCDDICQNLRSRFGIAVIANPTEMQLRMADYAALLRAPRKPVDLQSDCIVFSPDFESVKRVTGGKKIKALKLSLPKRINDMLPDGFAPLPIVSLAARYGFFDTEEIEVIDYRLDNAV